MKLIIESLKEEDENKAELANLMLKYFKEKKLPSEFVLSSCRGQKISRDALLVLLDMVENNNFNEIALSN
jgi:hypothetical protein